MIRKKTSENEHIKKLGAKWNVALAAAMLSAKTNSKLTGLDKIRSDLSHCAALKATGCPDHEGFVFGKGYGEPTREIQDIADAAFKAAVEAVREALQVSA